MMKTLTVKLDMKARTIELDAGDLSIIEIMGVASHLKLWAELQDVAAIHADTVRRNEEKERAQAAKAD